MSRYPLTERLVRRTYQDGYEQRCLDTDLRLQTLMWHIHREGRLEDLIGELDELMERCTNESASRAVLEPWLDGRGAPDGDDWRWVLLNINHLARQVQERPDDVTALELEDDEPGPFRAARFFDEASARRAVGEVLRRHETALREWSDAPEGSWRRHLYADLGWDVGKVIDRRQPFDGPVTGAVVIVVLDDQRIRVHDSYPELPLDETVRARYPDLPHLFGAYFGDVPEPPWLAQQDFIRWTHAWAKERMVAQLHQLLELPDDELRSAVAALGSHIVPHACRAWVLSMVHRFTSRVWTDDDGQPIDFFAMTKRRGDHGAT